MIFDTLFFDLDDTIYPSTSGLWFAIRNRMNEYMERMGLPKEEIPRLRQSYLERFGTTLRGLQQDYQIDVTEYLNFVHDLPLKDYLDADPVLRTILGSLPQSRWIFTNSDKSHAQRVLNVLQIEDCFDGIIDIRALDFVCKPDPEAYRRAAAIAGVTSIEGCMLFDDAPRNLAPAKRLGFTTVLVADKASPNSADFTISSLHQLRQSLPQLWRTADQPVSVTMSKKVTDER